MPIDQDWTNVWPSAHTFKWSVVPLPVRQGYVEVRVMYLLETYFTAFLLKYYFNAANFQLLFHYDI